MSKFADQVGGFSDRRGDGWCVPQFLEYIRESQSFNHLSDSVIRSWILGRLELLIFGEPRRDRQYSGYEKRQMQASMYELRFVSETSWLDRFEEALRHSVKFYPAWVDDLVLSGSYSQAEAQEYLEEVRAKLSFRESEPKVRGAERLVDRDVNRYGIDLNEALIRMALTFGCVCPITGQFVQPSQTVKIASARCWKKIDMARYVAPLGFCAFKRIWRSPNLECLEVMPFSDKGWKLIEKAVSKCAKALDGRIDETWVLAEVMQSALIKKAA